MKRTTDQLVGLGAWGVEDRPYSDRREGCGANIVLKILTSLTMFMVMFTMDQRDR
jgi:hypothetical protein